MPFDLNKILKNTKIILEILYNNFFECRTYKCWFGQHEAALRSFLVCCHLTDPV